MVGILVQNWKVSRYLDMWRGAFYSVLLGIMWQDFIRNSNQPNASAWVFLFAITLFLLVDGITRFNSRETIRANRAIGVRHEFLVLLTEFCGLIFLIYWASKSVSSNELPTERYCLCIALFSSAAALHNVLFIRVDQGFKSFLKKSILEDASEIQGVSERWQGRLVLKRTKIIADTVNQKAKLKTQLQRSIKAGLSKDEGATFSKIKRIKKKGAWDLGIIHLAMQFLALHLFVFNLFGFFIIFLKWALDVIKSSSQAFSEFWSLVPSCSIYVKLSLLLLFGLGVSFCYYHTSYKEIGRQNEDGGSDPPTASERNTQMFGNLFLMVSVAFFYLLLPQRWLVTWILIQQTAIGLMLLFLQKGRQE